MSMYIKVAKWVFLRSMFLWRTAKGPQMKGEKFSGEINKREFDGS